MIKQVLKYLGVFLLWNIAAGGAILALPAPAGAVVALLLSGALLQRYLLRAGRAGEARRRTTLRLRPLGPEARKWTLAAIPVLLVLTWALGEVYIGIVPVPPESFDPFGPITDTPLGRLSIALLAIAVAPVLEEFFFRGLIQRSLERRWGAGPAIIGAAALFALVHVLPWIFPLHLFLGVVFGWAVYATRSIWAGVALHAANNAAAVLGMNGAENRPLSPTLWQASPSPLWWSALAALAVAAPVAFWVAHGMWQAGREGRSRR